MAAAAGNRPPIEIDESPGFQGRNWRFRKAAWVAMALMLGAGGAGLFGRGPLSRSETGLGAGITLEYEHAVRSRAPMTLRFRVDAPGNDTLRVHVGLPLLERARVLSIEPAPVATVADSGGLEYRFLLRAPGSVAMHLQPSRPGRIRVPVRIGSGAPVVLSIIIWP